MKKNVLISISFFVLSLLFSACSNDDHLQVNTENDAKTQAQQIETLEMDELGAVIPFIMNEEDYGITIGFMQYARQFYLDPKLENIENYIQLLKTAMKNKTPIRVYVIASTNDIALIENATEVDIENYKISLKAPVQGRSTAPIIPNETILNQIVNEIKSTGITFTYPVDGCYYRAHAMRRIIKKYGYDCNKLFLYGNLSASNGSCCVGWVYHVAPFIRYKNANGQEISAVIDPSLFPNSVAVDAQVWMNACRNKNCYSGASYNNYLVTGGDVYYSTPDGFYVYDNNYIKTDCVWNAFKGYSGCNTPPPSVSHCG